MRIKNQAFLSSSGQNRPEWLSRSINSFYCVNEKSQLTQENIYFEEREREEEHQKSKKR
jgi:hypothetical protein